jgi:hypothetical protein
MPVLLLENLPAELYGRIERMAQAEGVSPAETAVRLLEEVVEERARRTEPSFGFPAGRTQREILEDILEHPFRAVPGAPTVVEMLREDRGR